MAPLGSDQGREVSPTPRRQLVRPRVEPLRRRVEPRSASQAACGAEDVQVSDRRRVQPTLPAPLLSRPSLIGAFPRVARLQVRPLAWVVSSAALGFLACSVADALSRVGTTPASVIFWAGILLIVVPVFFRLTSHSPTNRERLLLVCVLGLTLYGVKVLQEPFLYTGTDELAHQYNADQIVLHHHLFAVNPLLSITSLYPGLEGATSALMELTGMSAFGAGMLLLGSARVVLMVALFLLFTRVSGSARIGGLGTAIYTANANFLFFDTQFSYESLALPLAVFVLAMVAERRMNPAAPSRTWLTPIALATAAVVVTHHLTSYGLAATLIIVSGVDLATRTRPPRVNPWPPAVVAVALSGTWMIVVASVTVGYLTPVIGGALSAAITTISGESTSRHLFTGAGGNTPEIERYIALASVGLLAIGFPFGLRNVWGRLRREAFTWIVAGGAVAIFGTYPLRFVPKAWETANRAGEFLFLGLAFVLACAPAGFLTPDRSRWKGRRLPKPHRSPFVFRALFTGCFAIVFMGGVIAGWPADTRLAQPLRVRAGGRVIDSERLALGKWVAKNLSGGIVVANETDARIVADYGHHAVVTGSDPDYQEVLTSSKLAPWELALLHRHHVRYVISDEQGVPNLFFPIGSSGDSQYDPLPASTVTKFDAAPASPIFNSGGVIIYDLQNRP
jgi:hypothetical protein